MSQLFSSSIVIRSWSEEFMRRSMRYFRLVMTESGLSFSQVNILMRLLHEKQLGVTEIGEQLGISNAAASQAVNKLVLSGLVERAENPHDRRAKQLTLTNSGKELLERGIEARGQWINKLSNSLSAEQKDLVITALTVLLEASDKLEE